MKNRRKPASNRNKPAEGDPVNRSADALSPRGENWERLRSHIDKNTTLGQLSRATRNELLSWMRRACPFRSLQDLQHQLGKAGIKGLNRQNQQAVVDSLRIGLTRRPFLATLGCASLASLGIGVTAALAADEEDGMITPLAVRPLIAAIQQQRQTVGQSTLALGEQQAVYRSSRLSGSTEWRQFLHALDMSNWMEAAVFLKDSALQKKLKEVTAGSVLTTLFQALRRLLLAWEYLENTRSQWEDKYFVGYAFGKMPALATATATQPVFTSDDSKAEEHAAAIRHMAPLFHALEILNQRFQRPARTRTQIPIRFTQGHNFSYAHLATDLQNGDLFQRNQRTVLINWDAHADLSDPFENPRMPIENPFDSLRNASTYAEQVVVSSSLSIAGWILPLVYQGLLPLNDQDARVVWVAPKEAGRTSRNYMEAYGKHSFLVGAWRLPKTVDEIAEFSTTAVGDWNVPERLEIRKFSEKKTLRSISSPDLLNHPKRCVLHIVDPDNTVEFASLVDGAQIALSIDADFAGTREPGLLARKGFLPHYPLTGSAAEQARHEQLMQRLADFYRRFERQIRTVTIANSPNFTVDEEIRKPVAKILKIVAGENLADQPAWIAGEFRRARPRQSFSGLGSMNLVLSAGGIVGLAVTAILLSRDWKQLHKIRTLLLPAE